jgi:hypothetical protein
MTLPCRWGAGGLGDFAGRARFRRHFGYPGQIDAYERVWLTFAGADAVADVWLNGQFLGRHAGAEQGFEFEVTGLLRRRNDLTVEVEGPAATGGLWGEVALEIRCTAFLRAVHAWMAAAEAKPVLHLTGEVVGTSDWPLDLYGLLDGSTAIYTTLEPAPEGRPFHLQSGELEPQRDPTHRVRIELVNGAVVWYTVEQTLTLRGREWKSTT